MPNGRRAGEHRDVLNRQEMSAMTTFDTFLGVGIRVGGEALHRNDIRSMPFDHHGAYEPQNFAAQKLSGFMARLVCDGHGGLRQSSPSD